MKNKNVDWYEEKYKKYGWDKIKTLPIKRSSMPTATLETRFYFHTRNYLKKILLSIKRLEKI